MKQETVFVLIQQLVESVRRTNPKSVDDLIRKQNIERGCEKILKDLVNYGPPEKVEGDLNEMALPLALYLAADIWDLYEIEIVFLLVEIEIRNWNRGNF